MAEPTVTIRELRTDFRSVKRKVEQHGQVVVTDRGEPAYELKALPRKRTERPPLPDYYVRLLEQRPHPMSPEETQSFWGEERGDR
jgi:antitoxin (DNA-binding transcriptional repressor) of toxin-antitoxin stability system